MTKLMKKNRIKKYDDHDNSVRISLASEENVDGAHGAHGGSYWRST